MNSYIDISVNETNFIIDHAHDLAIALKSMYWYSFYLFMGIDQKAIANLREEDNIGHI